MSLPPFILETYPDLLVDPAGIRQEQGQFNDIYIVNEALIFRFPRYAHRIPALRQELSILEHIQHHLPLPVPRPVYACLDPEIPGRVFMGYPLIPGRPLWRETLRQLDDKTQNDIAAQLAGFLAALHALPAGNLVETVPVKDTRSEWADLYAQIQQHLFPFMRPDAQAEVSAHFEGFLLRRNLLDFRPVISHGDFGSSNILFDPAGGTITGIIDWEFAGLGDPATDLAAVSTYGDSFFAHICAHYPVTAPLLERTCFYRGTFALDEALHGYLHEDAAALQAGLAAYV
jgi:aminoglycoside 2''-phosphotransferase